jgi:hypothetical protein
MIERRPQKKGKGKLSQAQAKYATKFQKKLVAIDYMGSDAPQSFGLKESIVLLRGMLPEIGIDASEHEVRNFIRDTMKDSDKTLAMLLPTDFEFMEADGKALCTPAHQSGFEWTGRAVKQLAGCGAVYVQLMTEREESDRNSDSSSFSSGFPIIEPEIKIVRIENAGTCYYEIVSALQLAVVLV